MKKIRLLLADDHNVLRTGLRMFLNAQPDMEVVGEAADCQQALARIRETRPNVLLLDLRIPGGSSLQLIEHLRHETLPTRAVVLTLHNDAASFRTALAAGAMGYLLKTASENELLAAIRSAALGRVFISREFHEDAAHPSNAEGVKLSRREREVLALLVQGYTNQEVADRLFISVKTVETYRGRITEKLGLRTRAELVRYAYGIGLSPSPQFDAALS